MRESRRALQIDPQNADIHDSRGDALLAQGRRAEAVAE
jgi:Tfp pilus assembly protein PilF